jgi:hypothetical protein
MPRSTINGTAIDLDGKEMILDADQDTTITADTDDKIDFKTGGSDRLIIDPNGDLGIGVSPESDHYSAYQNTNFGLTGLLGSASSGTNTTFLTNNAYLNTSANWIYKEADEATKYNQVSGTHIWETASSGSAGATISFSEVMKIDATGAVTKPLQPAFLAKLNGQQSNLTNDGNLQTVEFDYEPFDQNADFNTSNYTFTAPVTGKYFFSVQLFLETIDTGATYYSLRLVTSNRTYENAFDPNFSADLERHTVQMSVLADMDASDTALMRILQVSGTSQTDINADNSTFSGYLVC